jgi:hypothetical protein
MGERKLGQKKGILWWRENIFEKFLNYKSVLEVDVFYDEEKTCLNKF